MEVGVPGAKEERGPDCQERTHVGPCDPPVLLSRFLSFLPENSGILWF